MTYRTPGQPPPRDPPPPADASSAREQWYRRYWGYYNRPYGGCGYVYLIVVLLAICLLLRLLVFPVAA